MKNKNSGGINIGTSLVLVTFVLLSLVTFASLSYMSARSDYTLSKEAALRTASFYDANRMAEVYLEGVEEALIKSDEISSSEEEYYASVEKYFDNVDNISLSKEDGKTYLSYVVSVTQGQNLEVKLLVNYPDNEGENYVGIEKWATAVDNEWLQEVTSTDSKESGVKLLFK